MSELGEADDPTGSEAGGAAMTTSDVSVRSVVEEVLGHPTGTTAATGSKQDIQEAPDEEEEGKEEEGDEDEEDEEEDEEEEEEDEDKEEEEEEEQEVGLFGSFSGIFLYPPVLNRHSQVATSEATAGKCIVFLWRLVTVAF